jgi:hypothetical protein
MSDPKTGRLSESRVAWAQRLAFEAMITHQAKKKAKSYRKQSEWHLTRILEAIMKGVQNGIADDHSQGQ